VTPYSDSVISFQFVVYLPYNETYIGSDMWVGTAVEVSDQRIWAAEINVTIVNTTFSDMVCIISSVFVSLVCNIIYGQLLLSTN